MQLLQRDMFREMYLCVLLRARHCCAVIQVMADVSGPLHSVLNVNNSAVADFEDRTSSNLEVDSQIGLTEVGYWSSVLLMVLSVVLVLLLMSLLTCCQQGAR